MNRAFKFIRLSVVAALVVTGSLLMFVGLALAKGVKGMRATTSGLDAMADGLRD